MYRLCVLLWDISLLLALLLMESSTVKSNSLQPFPCPIRLQVISEDSNPVEVEMQKNGSKYVFVLLGFEEGDGKPRPVVQDPDDALGRLIEEQYAFSAGFQKIQPDENLEDKKATGTNIDTPKLKGPNSPEKCFNQTPLKQKGRTFNTNSELENFTRLMNKEGNDFSKDLDPVVNDEEFHLQPEHFNGSSLSKPEAKDKNTLGPTTVTIISDKVLENVELERKPLSQNASSTDLLTVTTPRTSSDVLKAIPTVQEPRNMQPGIFLDSSSAELKFNDTILGHYRRVLHRLELKNMKGRLSETFLRTDELTSITQSTTYSPALVQQLSNKSPDYVRASSFRESNAVENTLKLDQKIYEPMETNSNSNGEIQSVNVMKVKLTPTNSNPHMSPGVIDQSNMNANHFRVKESYTNTNPIRPHPTISEKTQAMKTHSGKYKESQSSNELRKNVIKFRPEIQISTPVIQKSEQTRLSDSNEPNQDEITVKHQTFSETIQMNSNPDWEPPSYHNLRTDIDSNTPKPKGFFRINGNNNMQPNPYSESSRMEPDHSTLRKYNTMSERMNGNTNQNSAKQSSETLRDSNELNLSNLRYAPVVIQESNNKQQDFLTSRPSLKDVNLEDTEHTTLTISEHFQANTNRISHDEFSNSMESTVRKPSSSVEQIEEQSIEMQPNHDVTIRTYLTVSGIRQFNHNQNMEIPYHNPNPLRNDIHSKISNSRDHLRFINEQNNAQVNHVSPEKMESPESEDKSIRQYHASTGKSKMPTNNNMENPQTNEFREVASRTRPEIQDSLRIMQESEQLQSHTFNVPSLQKQDVDDTNDKRYQDISERIKTNPNQPLQLPSYNSWNTATDSTISKSRFSQDSIKESNNMYPEQFNNHLLKDKPKPVDTIPTILRRFSTVSGRINQNPELASPSSFNTVKSSTAEAAPESLPVIQEHNNMKYTNFPFPSLTKINPDDTSLRRQNAISDGMPTNTNLNRGIEPPSFLKTGKSYLSVSESRNSGTVFQKQNNTKHTNFIPPTLTEMNPDGTFSKQNENISENMRMSSPNVLQPDWVTALLTSTNYRKIVPGSINMKPKDTSTPSNTYRSLDNGTFKLSGSIMTLENYKNVPFQMDKLSQYVSSQSSGLGILGLSNIYKPSTNVGQPKIAQLKFRPTPRGMKSFQNLHSKTLSRAEPSPILMRNTHRTVEISKRKDLKIFDPRFMKVKNSVSIVIQNKPVNITFINDFSPSNGERIESQNRLKAKSALKPSSLKSYPTEPVENVTCLTPQTISQRRKTLSLIFHKSLKSCPTNFPCKSHNSCSLWITGLVEKDFQLNRWKSQSYLIELFKGLHFIKRKIIWAAFQDCVVRNGLGLPIFQRIVSQNDKHRDHLAHQPQNFQSMNIPMESLVCESRVEHFRECFFVAHSKGTCF